MGRVALRVLGTFEVEIDGRPVPGSAWEHRRAAELVKLLALAKGERLHRERIIDALWPDLPPDAAAANLRKAAHYARSVLGSPESVGMRGGFVELWPGATIEVDAARFEAAALSALRSGDPDACVEAARLYGGELLPDDLYADWADGPREHLRELWLALLRRAGLWERVVAEEPTDEAAQRALIELYGEAGNRHAALFQYERLREALADVDLEPAEETADLRRRIAHAPLEASPIRYVRAADGVTIAYQVVEGGPADVLLIPGWISHLQLDWEEPYWVVWCERMTSFARLIRFDKRGTGLSDRPPGVQALEGRAEDALAVMDAAGLERAHVLGWSEGGPLALLLASRHPERVLSLILYGTASCWRYAPDYPSGMTAEQRETSAAEIEAQWGDLALAELFAPAGDPSFARRWAAYMRAGASPRAAADLNRANLQIDVRGLLGTISTPTLVLNRHGDGVGPPEDGRYMAERIPGARFVELSGEDHVMWLGRVDELCGEIERFVSAAEAWNVSGTPAS